MFEKKFLAYVLYVTLLEFRESAYKTNDSRLYHLTDILHNIPFSLLDEKSAKLEYDKMLEAVESLQISDWLEKRMLEFKNRFSEFE
jgi:hypothetical protein